MKPGWRRDAVRLGAALAAEGLLLGMLAQWSDLAGPGHAWKFVAAAVGSGVFYLLAVAAFGKPQGEHRPRWLWLAAILLRLAVWPMLPSDDFPRYLWEGRVQLAGANPYLQSPEAQELAGWRDLNWEQINHRDWKAIYPPGTEMLFRGLAKGGATPAWDKLLFAAADLGTLGLILRLLTGAGRYRAAAWYAWNPLVILSFAGAAHFDSLMLFAMTAAILCLHRANPINACKPAWSWSTASVFFLGVAIAFKIVPVFLLPVWAFALGRRAWLLVISLAVPCLLSWPYGGPGVVLAPLREFGDVARFNELFWWLPEQLGISNLLERIVELGGWIQITQHNQIHNAVMALAALGAAIWFRDRWRLGVLAVLGVVLVLGPACHPWYVTWILPIACWRKARSWFVLSITILLALLVWEAGPFWVAWELTWPLRLLIVLPPLLVVVAAALRFRPA